MSSTRQIAVIMFTDIVGYTALMGENEKMALTLLRKNKEVHNKWLKQYNGKWLKEMGDGILASFQTISDAVYCAGSILHEIKEIPELNLRIGIHLGEVEVDGNELYGDGVNIASRIEGVAESGQLLVSETIYNNIRNKEGIDTTFLGEHELKNVGEPVKIYSVEVKHTPEPFKEPRVVEMKGQKSKWMLVTVSLFALLAIVYFLVMPLLKEENLSGSGSSENEISEKSIAVLPFTNMSNDPDQEYFSDGMMEEILNHLFKIGDLQVTSRTSVMQYKGTTKSIREISRELGVNTILEGSVRKSGNQVRITVQLIDGKTDKHLLSETYDRQLNDVFQIQSEVAQQIATVLKAVINPEVKKRIQSTPTRNMEAYDKYLESRYNNLSAEETEELLLDIIRSDSTYADAYIQLGISRVFRIIYNRDLIPGDQSKYLEDAKELINKGLALDPYNVNGYLFLGSINLWFGWDFEKAEYYFSKAIQLSPAQNQTAYTEFLLGTGRFEDALENANRTIKSNPNNANSWLTQALCYFFLGEESKTKESINISKQKDDSGLNNLIRLEIYLGNYDGVINMFESNTIEYPLFLGSAAIAYYHKGNPDQTMELLEKLKLQSSESAIGSPAFFIAMVYAQMGEADLSFQWLEKAYQDKEVEMYWLMVEPPFEPLHNDTRWQEILDKVGFPK